MAKILIIEDESRIQFQAIEKIQSTLHEIELAISIEGAINYLYNNQNKLDLIILDVMMNPAPFDAILTNKGDETGWVFYDLELRHLNCPVIVWTQNRDIFLKNWDPVFVKYKILKGKDDDLLEAIKSICG
jgi:CheY-like chemotaxis protein